MTNSEKQISVSLIIPVYNEEWSVVPLYRKIEKVKAKLKDNWEIIFVNDGSTDKTIERLNELREIDSSIKVISLNRRYGLTQGIQAGFDNASGKYAVTISGNLQNDPEEIPVLIEQLEDGNTVCVGWRNIKERGELTRHRPGKMLSWLISKISGVKLHDYECLFRAYRTEAVKNLRFTGNMHRYLPVYIAWQGGSVVEQVVSGLPSSHGDASSKSTAKNTFKTLLDLVFLKFLQRYSSKPLYIFGGLGLLAITGSVSGVLAMVVIKARGLASFIETPLPIFSALLFLTGVLLIVLGIMSEMLTRIFLHQTDNEFYKVQQD